MASRGPLGGTETGPNFFVDFNHPDPNLRITGITVWSNVYIDAFQLHYVDMSSGTAVDGDKHGGSGGCNPITITFGGGDVLVDIDIRAGNWIDALAFSTRSGARYVFGGIGGTPQGSLSVDNTSTQEIFALSGTCGDYLNSLIIDYQ